LAVYRAGLSNLRARATAAGIEDPESLSPEELWTQVNEREAIQGEGTPDHGAEFDRLAGRAPNFDAAAGQRLAAATAATKARATNFGQPPVSNVLAKAGASDLYRM